MLFFKKRMSKRSHPPRRRLGRVLENLESRRLMASDLEINATFGDLPTQTVELGVVNGGFEDISGENSFNEFTFGALNGWDVYDPNDVTSDGDGPTYFIGTLMPGEVTGQPGVIQNFPGGAAEGQRVGIAFNYSHSGDGGEYGMRQSLSETLEANTTYTLQVDIGNIATGIAQSGQTFYLGGMPGYRIDLMAGDVVVASDNDSLSGLIPEGEFMTSSIRFHSGADHPQLGETLSIRLVNLNQSVGVTPGHDLEVDFDNVHLFATTVDTQTVQADPILMVISNQDFWYSDYADALEGFDSQGLDVVVAAETIDVATPQWGSGYGLDGGWVIPDIALVDVDADDYSGIFFVGGWGMSRYQYAFDGIYDNPAYNGTAEIKTIVNDLINDFVDQDKIVSAVCYGVSVLAYARVDGVGLLDGRDVTGWNGAAPSDNLSGPNNSRWHIERNGANMLAENSIGDPTTATDDVWIDGNIITAQDFRSAFAVGQVLGRRINEEALDEALMELLAVS